MNTVISFLFTLFVWGHPGEVSSVIDVTQAVGVSLRNGDASQLSARFAETIGLVIDTENIDFQALQATHAELILRVFFRKYPPQRFQFVYRRSSDKHRHSTGIYESNGQVFSVYVLMCQTPDRHYAINALHFRKE